MAAHRNLKALKELYDRGSISQDTANMVLEGTAMEDALRNTPNAPNSVPHYHAPNSVPHYRVPNAIPHYHAPNGVKVDMVRPESSHESPPVSEALNETYVTSGGIVTGRTNKEQARINALLESERPIDNVIAENAYSALVRLGHSGPVAKGVADEIRDANVNKETRLGRVREMLQPAISPLYITQADLAQMANSKDTVPDSTKVPFMKGIFEEYLTATGSPEKAKFEASQAGLLIDEYNSGLASGLSPPVAYGKAMNAVEHNYKYATRAAVIAGGGQRVAQEAADKITLEQVSANEMFKAPPGLRPKLLERKAEAENAQKMNRMQKLNDELVETHVKEPIIRAHQKLQQAAALKDAASKEGMLNPVVQEKILTDVVAASAEDSAKAAEELRYAKEVTGPNQREKNALNFLSEVNTEKAIADINHENEEKQKKAMEMMKEANEHNAVKAAEERLAMAKEQQIIEEKGENAFNKAYGRTGDVVQAGIARQNAENAAKEKLKRAREAREAQVMKMLGPIGASSDSIQDAVKHIATAHAGLNAVGSTLEDLKDKYEEELKHQMNTEELLKETAGVDPQVKEIIPPTTSKVGITEGKMKLPLKGFSGEEANTEEERLVQSGQKKKRGLVRNRVVGVPIESGLNVIETNEGYIHIPEAAKSLKVNKGKVFYPENAKGIMEKQKLDTSGLEHKYNTGERKDLEKGVGYYEADAGGYTLPLPSPSDPVPASVMTNGEDILNIEHASGMYIEDGDLLETPWSEFVKRVRPTINGAQLQEDEVIAASEMKAKAENERKFRNLEGITTEVYTNPDGSKFVQVSPPYGVPELMTMEEAVENLNSVGASSVSAVSQESKKQSPDIPLDMATTESEKGSEEGFINSVLSRVEKTGDGAEAVSKNNELNGEVNKDKAPLFEQVQKEMIEKYLSPPITEEASVRNAIVQKAEAYAGGMGVTTQDFLTMISQIPDSSIKEMMNYNRAPPSSRKDITQTQFYNQIAHVLPNGSNVNPNAVTEVIFNNIAMVTHMPNSVGGEILERVTVPNLKTIEQVETKRTPNGVTQVSISVPNQPGKDQVLGEIKMKGPPIPTVPGSNKVPPKTGATTNATGPNGSGATNAAGLNGSGATNAAGSNGSGTGGIGSNVPLNPRNPVKPGVTPVTNDVKPNSKTNKTGKPKNLTGNRPEHILNRKVYTYNDPNDPLLRPHIMRGPPTTSGFTGRVPKSG